MDDTILLDIQARYMASVMDEKPPSLTAICGEFDLSTTEIAIVIERSRAGGWEDIRLANYRAAKKALLYGSEGIIEDLMLNFHKAMRSVLAERLMKFTQFSTLIDDQLLERLRSDGSDGQPARLNVNQLIRLKELMIKEAGDITRIAYDIAKELNPDGKGGDAEDAATSDDVAGAVSKWKAGAKVIEATGTTQIPEETQGQVNESERVSLFKKLDQEQKKPQ